MVGCIQGSSWQNPFGMQNGERIMWAFYEPFPDSLRQAFLSFFSSVSDQTCRQHTRLSFQSESSGERHQNRIRLQRKQRFSPEKSEHEKKKRKEKWCWGGKSIFFPRVRRNFFSFIFVFFSVTLRLFFSTFKSQR